MTDPTLKPKDPWDKAGVTSQWIVPLTVAFATLAFNYCSGHRASDQRNFEVAVNILQSTRPDDTSEMRTWAEKEFTNATGISLNALEAIQPGTRLSASTTLQLPNPGPLRVTIMRLEGASLEQSASIEAAVRSGGYLNVVLAERPAARFPDSAEVRYYYPADSQNAQSLSDHINRVLKIPARLNDRSADRDASSHRPGDLHIYVR